MKALYYVWVGVLSMGVAWANKITERLPQSIFKMPVGIKEDEYLKNTVVFKIKEQYRCTFIPGIKVPEKLGDFFKMIGAYDFQRMFPHHVVPPRERYGENGRVIPDLSTIYTFKYMTQLSLEYVINKLIQTGLFEYVEPYYLPRPLFIPNDPNYGSQWHLPKINAPLAWDYSQGSPSVVVAITDTGVLYTHNDLSPNILVNTGETPNNGFDDDGNGYVDDYYGWDFGDNDNNPLPGSADHGTHVAGCASAATNNGIGVAAPGFSCKILAVKIENSQGQLVGGYQGIVYAADRGANFINASWGSTYYSSLGQDVIDYALSKGSMVICGAGNNGNTDMFYPAAYDGAIAVASTNSNDQKSNFSSYGFWVDICAPGELITSTVFNNSYAAYSGTSMASPVMAGCAALIKSYFTSYSNFQAVARAKATAYDIYPLNPLSYKYRLGAGRVDIGNALSQPAKAYVEMIAKKITSNTSSYLPGDTLSIVGIFQNYLSQSGTVTCSLTTFSPYVSIINSTATLPPMNTMQKDSNQNNPFRVVIKSNAPMNQEVWFTVIISDGSFTAYSSFNIFVNVDYINITINDLYTTQTSKGLIGYNQFNQIQGLGVKFAGQDLLFEMGLMIGSNNKVVDYIRNGQSNDADFQVVSRVQEIQPPVKADFEAEGTFSDAVAPASDKLDILVRHHTYAWSSPGHRKYIIVEYIIRNTGTSPLSPLYAGIFADWDIPNANYDANRCTTILSKQLTFAYNLNTPLYGGIRVVSQTPFISYCINNDGTGGSVNIYDDYTSQEKYTTLSNNRDTSGYKPGGTDVSAVTSTGPFTIAPGDSVTVAFAIIVDTTLNGLLVSADSAYVKYNGYTTSSSETKVVIPGYHIFPNPTNHIAYISGVSYSPFVQVSIYDLYGKRILHRNFSSNSPIKEYAINTEDLPIGHYIVEVIDQSITQRFNLIVIR